MGLKIIDEECGAIVTLVVVAVVQNEQVTVGPHLNSSVSFWQTV